MASALLSALKSAEAWRLERESLTRETDVICRMVSSLLQSPSPPLATDSATDEGVALPRYEVTKRRWLKELSALEELTSNAESAVSLLGVGRLVIADAGAVAESDSEAFHLSAVARALQCHDRLVLRSGRYHAFRCIPIRRNDVAVVASEPDAVIVSSSPACEQPRLSIDLAFVERAHVAHLHLQQCSRTMPSCCTMAMGSGSGDTPRRSVHDGDMSSYGGEQHSASMGARRIAAFTCPAAGVHIVDCTMVSDFGVAVAVTLSAAGPSISRRTIRFERCTFITRQAGSSAFRLRASVDAVGADVTFDHCRFETVACCHGVVIEDHGELCTATFQDCSWSCRQGDGLCPVAVMSSCTVGERKCRRHEQQSSPWVSLVERDAAPDLDGGGGSAATGFHVAWVGMEGTAEADAIHVYVENRGCALPYTQPLTYTNEE